ncbi:MFS transporter [Hyphomonas sp. FCG-A18]|jgi:MFS family permease|uniref:MFS transporter n=1 Tax=Hyphomonas sp. FCG-A18 TaxID=3080019 RepID=UPI002B2DDBE0|nr:MFS transporter [Hyphomonas sp. FCG-A18]
MANRFAAFQHFSYRRYFFARFGGSLAGNVIAVTVAWQVYAETGNPLYLGWIGLVQFLPSLLLVLVTGLAADRFGRRVIMGLSIFLQMACALALLLITALGQFNVILVLGVVTVTGIARAFYAPAANSLVVNLVPREDFPNAVSWNASSWQVATILGPSLGGVLSAVALNLSYGFAAFISLSTAVLIFTIPKPEQARGATKTDLATLLGGFKYIWKTKIVLGAISLDLFAVLLGGAVALLPVYAKDILQIGEAGYGVLRAAPSVGAVLMIFVITSVEIKRHAGLILFVFTALFGLMHIVFGYSEIVWLSVLALVLIGAFDMISVYVRETLMQLWTPDEVRGRVNAVNSIFIGASNQIGEARAGFMAARWGTVFTVVAGGYLAIGVTALWAAMFPELRKVQDIQSGVDPDKPA